MYGWLIRIAEQLNLPIPRVKSGRNHQICNILTRISGIRTNAQKTRGLGERRKKRKVLGFLPLNKILLLLICISHKTCTIQLVKSQLDICGHVASRCT